MEAFVRERTNLLHLVLLGVAITVAATVTVVVLSGQQGAQAQDASTPGSYVVTDLGSLGGPSSIGGPNSTAIDINEAGQVVGWSHTSIGRNHAFLYDEDATPKMMDLGTLGGPSSATLDSAAFDINDAGQVVGYSNISEDDVHAFLYDASATPKMTDLGTLGGLSSGAQDVNDAGQIVGRGYHNGLTRGFLLTPQKNYTFSGFFRPVDNPPTLNVVKVGSAVPLKLSLEGMKT